MKRQVLDIVGRLVDATGLARLLARRNPHRVVALMYHGIGPEQPDFYHWCQLPVNRFRRHLDYLKRVHQVVSVDDLVEACEGGASLPPGAVVVTFDDGFRNNRTRAFPELAARGLPATIFLSTGCVETGRVPWPELLFQQVHATDSADVDLSDLGLGRHRLNGASSRWEAYVEIVETLKRVDGAEKERRLEEIARRLGPPEVRGQAAEEFQPMDWNDVQALHASGLISFGPHTVDHEILSRLDDAELERQIRESCAAVARGVGRGPTVFAYPNGRREDFDERAQSVLRECGIRCAFSTEPGSLRPADEALSLRRIGIGADLSYGHFVLLCCGLIDRRRPGAA